MIGRAGLERLVGATALAVALTGVGFALPAAAAAAAPTGPLVTWCGAAAPALNLDGFLPGDERSVSFDLCNNGDRAGQLNVSMTGGQQGLAGDFLRLTLLDSKRRVWSGEAVNHLDVVRDAAIGPGQSRHFTLTVAFDPAADNRVQGAHVGFGIRFELSLPGGAGAANAAGAPASGPADPGVGGRPTAGGEAKAEPPSSTIPGVSVNVGNGVQGVEAGTVAVPSESGHHGGQLPFTGSDAGRVALTGVTAVAVGALLSKLRLRFRG